MAAHNGFLSLLLKDIGEMHSIFSFVIPVSTAVGIMLAVSTLFETPVMLFSTPLLRALGNRRTLYAALAIIAIRNLYYSMVTDTTQILLAQTVHGLTFAIVWLAGVNFAAIHAPRGLSATAQGLFSTVLLSVGFATGNLICGPLIDAFGVQGMFLVMGIFGFASLSLVLLFQQRIKTLEPS
jgi:PPP family 3-phenylpropionic acid transporter